MSGGNNLFFSAVRRENALFGVVGKRQFHEQHFTHFRATFVQILILCYKLILMDTAGILCLDLLLMFMKENSKLVWRRLHQFITSKTKNKTCEFDTIYSSFFPKVYILLFEKNIFDLQSTLKLGKFTVNIAPKWQPKPCIIILISNSSM